MSRWSTITKHVIVALALAGASGRALAQNALNGSDTLETVMIDAIDRASNPPYSFFTPGFLTYKGGGSTTGETAVTQNKQSIAAMSRNLKSSVIGTGVGKFTANGALNVVGLDAAVIVTYGGAIKNLNLPTFADVVDNTNKAFPNKWGVCSGAAATRCAANGDCLSPQTCQLDASASYTQLLEVVMSGVDGSGSTLACAHPARIQAILDLAAKQGTTTGFIDHYLRRDDNSGTTDTFKEKIAVKNFCNGRARGILGTLNTANPNLNNQDIDPIRLPCPAIGTYNGAPRRATTCTNVSTGAFCTASDNPAGCDPTLPYTPGGPVGVGNGCPCTQGFVVALSAGDNGTDLIDVTQTIGSRVSADNAGQTFGFAGREAVRVAAFNSTGPAISTFGFGDATIRNDDYLLSRRLFLARGPANDDAVALTPYETVAGGAAKKAAENALFTFMTDDGTTSPDGSIGACNIKDIVKKRGYLSCVADPCTETIPATNLCAKTFPPGPSFPSALIPNSGSGGPGWDYGPVACTAGSFCATNNSACPGTLTCPTGFGARPAGYACSMGRECQSNLCADNGQGIGILVCQ